jgi:hypothetical protein
MTASFKSITCPKHRGVKVARIEVEPDGKKAVLFSTRVLWGRDQVLGGRKAEPENKTRLRLDDERIVRGAIPFVVTWCPRCSREFVLPIEWVVEEAKHSGTTTAVLESWR